MNEMLKKRIEKAEVEFADREYEIGEIDYDALCKGFFHGAEYALSHQWISVEEELPEEYEEVLCMMKPNYAIVSGYIYKDNGIVKVDTPPDFHFEDYEGYEVIAYMPIPKFEPKEKEEKR